MNLQRGWVVTNQEGTVLKQCSNCETFSKCEKNPKWNFRPCKDYQKLSEKAEETK